MKSLIFFLFVVALVATIGGIFTGPNVGPMYQEIKKPSWAPPGWLFGPVWSVLYVLIALAGWRIWTARIAHDVKLPMALYWTQLILNGLWTLIYFEFRLPWTAFVEISALFLVIATCMVAFWKISHFAAFCFVPYGLWVGFAAILNFELALGF